jgi:hypothetical protein
LHKIEGTWIRVLDVQLQPMDSDPLGQLSMAQLRLSCLSLVDVDVKIRRVGSTPHDFYADGGVLIIGGKSLDCWISFDYLGNDENYKLQRAKAMPILTYHGDFRVTGLLLEPTGEQRGQYQRIGWFCFIKEEASKAFASNMVKPSYQVPEEECLQIEKDKDGKIQRAITLV